MNLNMYLKRLVICSICLLTLMGLNSNLNDNTASAHTYYYYTKIKNHRNHELTKIRHYIRWIKWYDMHHSHRISINQESNYLYYKCNSMEYLTHRQKSWIINHIVDINNFNYKKRRKVAYSSKQPMLTRPQQRIVNKMRRRYNYLAHNEDAYTGIPNSKYNQEIVDWVNFYRHDIFNEDPVQEDSQYDNYAQEMLDNNKDPEDSGSSTEPNIIDSYITDQNDMDNNNQTTHRSSVLNPDADFIGVGRAHGWNGLYFNGGLDDGAGDNDSININYPTANVFSIEDAKSGEFWTHSFIENPSNNGTPVPTPHISVYDNNANCNVPISNVHTSSSEIYYNINPNYLHLYHTYTINIHGNRSDSTHYRTTLFNLY